MKFQTFVLEIPRQRGGKEENRNAVASDKRGPGGQCNLCHRHPTGHPGQAGGEAENFEHAVHYLKRGGQQGCVRIYMFFRNETCTFFT